MRGKKESTMILYFQTSVEHSEKQIAYTKRSVPPLEQKLWTNFGKKDGFVGNDKHVEN